MLPQEILHFLFLSILVKINIYYEFRDHFIGAKFIVTLLIKVCSSKPLEIA